MLEAELASKVFSQNTEKTFISKVLGEKDAERLRKLMRKNNLGREDLLEILYLLGGTESKLLNFGQWDRYVILKFFVWIREVTKIAELFFDYKEQLQSMEERENNPLKVTEETKKLIHNSQMQLEHSIKFLVDLYLNIARSSVSLGMSGLTELVRNRFEFSYPQMGVPQQQNKGFRILGRGGNNNGN